MSGETSMNLFTLTQSRTGKILTTALLCITLALAFSPILAGAQATTGATAQTPTTSQGTSCQSWGSFFWNFPTCGGRGIAVWSSSVIISMTGWILGMAGVLMNTSLEFTTIGFDTQIYNRISGGIEAVWTAFRDIANIVIIGMFTFIALSMILGLEKFNARQMVAKVLLIAILINFSLLFTRIIITSSNFVATQFYKAAQFNSEGGVQGATGGQPYDQYSAGISGKFAQLLGVGGVLDTKDALWKASESADNGWVALLMGLLSAFIFLTVSLVFLYIAFLLIARAILFIFLLITSSLAFASYLIPGKGAIGGYGWDAWWSSLLKNAVFAPLLLMLLWATLQVGAGIKATSGSIGGLLADPAKGGNINALFSYLLILGMLYVSIKIATSFSHKIGGFDMAKAFASSPFAVGARYGLAPFLRNAPFFGGRGALKRSLALDDSIDAEKKASAEYRAANPGATYDNSKLAKLLQQKAKADRFSKSTYDPFNTKSGQFAGKAMGVPSALMGSTKTNFAETAKARADAAAKLGAEAGVSKDDAKNYLLEKRKTEREGLQAQRETAHQLVQVAQTSASQAKQAEDLDRKHSEARARLAREEDQGSRAKVQVQERFDNGRISAADRQTMMRAIDDRIQKARTTADVYHSRINAIDRGTKGAEQNLEHAETAIKDFHKEVDAAAGKIAEAGTAQAHQTAAVLAGAGIAGMLNKVIEMTPDDVTTQMARGLAKKKIKAKGIAAQRQAEIDILGAAGLNTPPPTP
jgi:hypothetical protein